MTIQDFFKASAAVILVVPDPLEIFAVSYRLNKTMHIVYDNPIPKEVRPIVQALGLRFGDCQIWQEIENMPDSINGMQTLVDFRKTKPAAP